MTTQQIYKNESLFALINKCIHTYNNLLVREDKNKLDLDSNQGKIVFRQHIVVLQQIIHLMDIQVNSRQFRKDYTKAYYVLYGENDLGYIPEILDSAQQCFPYIWVNGQYFQFSQQVIYSGNQLIQKYFQLVQLLKSIINDSQSLKLIEIKNCLQPSLKVFDDTWIEYQQKYIRQLIQIQQKAKYPLRQAIQSQIKLSQYEIDEKKKGKIFICGDYYHSLRKKLTIQLAHLNSIANSQGKGRDDLTYNILVAAQNIINKITPSQSQSVRKAANKIRQSFQKIRIVLRNLSSNLQIVDPQLKNNIQLSNSLHEYQKSWQKGKRYFLEQQKQTQLLAFSTAIETTLQKYTCFNKMVQNSQPSIFWIIPSLIILRSLEGEDEGLAESFLKKLPQSTYLNYKHIRQQYQLYKASQIGKNIYHCYNTIELCLIEQKNILEQTDQHFIRLITSIKQLSINLQRVNPLDWNDMLSVIFID